MVRMALLRMVCSADCSESFPLPRVDVSATISAAFVVACPLAMTVFYSLELLCRGYLSAICGQVSVVAFVATVWMVATVTDVLAAT